VLVAPDKFKGSLSARQAADAVVAGLQKIQGITVDSCPVADGGEGFAEALATRWDQVAGVKDPLGRPVVALCGWIDATTAVIEMSEASGMRRLAPAERNPWEASTFGTGQLIAHAAARGAARILVGLGGSATNDAGAGVAAALGWQFLTSDGEPLDPRPANFLAIERIEPPEGETLPLIVAACDVRNPLLGPEGASRVYGPQKGADERTVSHLEMALEHLADLVAEQIGVDLRGLPGAGAAGGLGYGMATFCHAELQSGFGLLAEVLGIEERIARCDLVITGEGRIDAQTPHGKAPAEIARLARKYDKPVAAVCGQLDPRANIAEWFDFVVPIESTESSPDQCFRDAAPLVERAAGRIAAWALRR
jgi:glycerate kinase